MGVVCLQNTRWPHIRYQEGDFLGKTCGSSAYIGQSSGEKNWEDRYIKVGFTRLTDWYGL